MSGVMSDTSVEDLVNDAVKIIPCEWGGCDARATVMGKGCIDAQHVAVCDFHHRWIRDVFDMIPPYVVCAICGKPMLVFEGHFSIVEI